MLVCVCVSRGLKTVIRIMSSPLCLFFFSPNLLVISHACTFLLHQDQRGPFSSDSFLPDSEVNSRRGFPVAENSFILNRVTKTWRTSPFSQPSLSESDVPDAWGTLLLIKRIKRQKRGGSRSLSGGSHIQLFSQETGLHIRSEPVTAST